jgi:NAD+ kinase
MMAQSMPVPQNIIILAHPGMQVAVQDMDLVKTTLLEHGLKTSSSQLNDHQIHRRIAAREFDLAIVLGGDGAILRAGHLCAGSDTPILGINYGRFGFLIELQRQNWMEYIPRMMRGDYHYESRMMLCSELWRGKEKINEWEVLNEVVVCRGQLVKPLHITAYVNGEFLTTYVADGLIASTPTGSTAYALAAGGPILPPELRNILLIPVAPHLSVNRAIILAEGTRVSITAHSDHQAVLSVDGQNPVLVTDNDRVDVYAGDHSLRFIRFLGGGYFYRSLMSHMEQNPATGLTR